MKFLIKKIFIPVFFFVLLLQPGQVYTKEKQYEYTKEDISNYFLGIIFADQGHNNKAYKELNKAQSLKKTHTQFNIEFIRTLILLEKFNQAFEFSESIWKEDELFFEADLLLGLNSFIEGDFKNAEKYFLRLNKISQYNLFFDNLIGNVLVAWVKASQGNEEDSYKFLNKIPEPYRHLKKTQNIFLQCYFDDTNMQKSLEQLINGKDYNFSRYNFFLVNYLLRKNKIAEAKKKIQKSKEKDSSNLLLKQSDLFLANGEHSKIKNFFNCKKPRDSIAEFFYVLANLYSSEDEYKLSNFYLKVSFFLNDRFLPNQALLAENFYHQKKNIESKNIYNSIKKIGSVYFWHASKNIASILVDEKGKKYSIKSLKKDFNLLPKINFEHYYELANFYKDNQYYEESIKYYSLALEKIKKNHFLIPKILERRGTSFERIGDWQKAEKDLIESLKILPDQAHVLNYLAYTWVDMEMNLEKSLKMLKKANQLRENDGYIIDSLGWAYYIKRNYSEANIFLQQAIQLLPSDPIINDHYADNLWMLNKNLQARYIWKSILKMKKIEQKLKDSINKKLIFGINKKS